MTYAPIQGKCPACHQDSANTAFQAGAASRDAEVVSLTNQRDYEYVRAENAEQERDHLREQVKMLRNELNMIYKLVPDLVVFQMEPSALAATEPK